MLTKESTEKLFIFLDNYENHETAGHIFKHASKILEELDLDIQESVEEYDDLKGERDNLVNEIEDLENDYEKLEMKSCEQYNNCPFESCKFPNIKTLEDSNKFEQLMEEF